MSDQAAIQSNRQGASGLWARLNPWGTAAVILITIAFLFPLWVDDQNMGWLHVPELAACALALAGICACFAFWSVAAWIRVTLLGVSVVFVAALSIALLHQGAPGSPGLGFWLLILGLWVSAWWAIDGLAFLQSDRPLIQTATDLLVPLAFGCWLLALWEIITVGFAVPQVLLPAPSAIGVRFAGSLPTLGADFHQTFIKAVLSGYAMGCGAGFLVAILADRVGFLKRGLLPLGNLVSALPIVGVAPIMVMWFGFDWPSKAAVVVIMTFFPMLVNTVSGLSATGALEKDLMRSYGAGYWPTLLKLRLPAAMPFIFNALKINSTLALIGAIVAEFFGTPIVGMGFRISTEVGRMNVDMVWAEILMAALAGSAFYGLIAIAERAVTFWHPSYRQRR